jgi:transcriptional regulator with PAS, ATPase and Fis domain
MGIREIKDRFGIIGDDPRLNSALDTAMQIAGTDLSVLITGESGAGKEVIPQIIHSLSPRKHNKYIAINCGAIPEGTVDSELFGHEKGSFTGANEARKGYFEVANGGTIFLDEVGELPLASQARLLRVLENGTFLRVGSSIEQKTDVRVIAASNINFLNAINSGKFREDLYYRLDAVPIYIPPLRERKNDIHLLFRKFALDFAEKYKMPTIRLTPEAQVILESYRWPGNVRQLKNVAEQMSVLENERNISPDTIKKYIPREGPDILPVRKGDCPGGGENFSDRDIIFKILMQLREEVDELKTEISNNKAPQSGNLKINDSPKVHPVLLNKEFDDRITDTQSEIIDDNNLSIQEVNSDLIKRALEKHDGKRKAAADELGISERTLYRKIKELNLDE